VLLVLGLDLSLGVVVFGDGFGSFKDFFQYGLEVVNVGADFDGMVICQFSFLVI
jgi:hypothetical protein